MLGARRKQLPNLLFTLIFLSLCAASYFHFDRSMNNVSSRAIQVTAESSHSDMVRVLSNTLSAQIQDILDLYGSHEQEPDWAEFAQTLEFVSLDQSIRLLLSGSGVLKVKVFATDGVTVFTTDLSGLGENLSTSPDVVHAIRGRPSSSYEYRETFASLGGPLSNIHVVSSYHPFRTAGGNVRGVLEVYSNREGNFQVVSHYAVGYTAQYILILSLIASAWSILIIYRATRSDKIED